MTDSVYDNKEINFALQDRASSLSPIFQHIANSKRPALDYTRTYDGISVHFDAREVLDFVEQSILLAVIALANIAKFENGRKAELLDCPSGGIGKGLAIGLATTGNRGDYSLPIVVKTTFYRLLKTAGMGQSKESRQRLKDGLKRLSRVSYEVTMNLQDGEREFSQRFLSYDWESKEDTIFIALNSMFSNAFCDQHSRIDLNERKELGNRNGIGLLLHSYLSSVINRGQSHSFNIDGLVEKFVECEPDRTEARKRKLRANFRKALVLLGTLEKWSAVERGSGAKSVMQITRK